MDGVSIKVIMELVQAIGLPGVLLVLWYWDSRKQDQRMQTLERMFHEQRRMYENSVELVKNTQHTALEMSKHIEAQQGIIALCAERFGELHTAISSNLFCPLQRFERRAQGVQA